MHSSRFSTIALALVFACGGDDRGGGGGGGGSNTCYTISNSCGQTIGGALCTSSNGGSCTTGTCTDQGTCAECTPGSGDACTGETICVVDRCQNAFPRFYEVLIKEADAPATPTTGCWDECTGPGNSSRPDIFVEAFVNGVSSGNTETDVDTWFADLQTRITFQITSPGSKIELKMYDEDIVNDGLSSNEIIVNCVADPLTPSMLRNRNVSCGEPTEYPYLAAEYTPK